MKQEYISTFLIKTSGMFSVEDTMKLQDLLQTTKDDAFPILMAINTPTTRGNIKRLAICIALLVISLFYARKKFFATFYYCSNTIPFIHFNS